MLLGRAAERDRVRGLLTRARTGASATLLITGDPGVGKTALLDDAVAAAGGMTVLRAGGTESESELPFAGLAELLGPVLEHRGSLPAPQSAALEAAVGVGPPVPGDRFTTSVAVLSLLGVAAEAAPVLAAVDDVHWLDAPSRDALAFVARRLRAEGVVLLLVARTGETSGLEEACGAPLRLRGLDLAATRSLLARAGAPEPAPDVVARLHAEAEGNPLAVLEVAALLSAEQRAGLAPVERPLPVGSGTERAFGKCLRGLPDDTRTALLVAAVSETGATDEVYAALDAAGLGTGSLEPAERAGLVVVGAAGVRFRHPLLRSVACASMPAPDRRAAHRLLADAVAGSHAAERRAWHRAAAATAPDETVAAALVEAAGAARARGAPHVAAAAGERAARLTPDHELRARRLLRTAEDLARHGGPRRARGVLDEALSLAEDPLLRADLQLLRGRTVERSGDAADAAGLLVAEAARIAPYDRRRAAAMTLAAVQPYFEAGRSELGLATAHRAWQLGEPVGLTPMPAGLPLGMALLLCGQRQRARPLLLRAAAWFDDLDDPWQLGPVLHFGLGQAFCWLGEHDRAQAILGRGIRQARESSAPALLPYGLLSQAELLFRTGRWVTAYAAASEAAELAEQTGQLNDRAFALCNLARVEAGLGRERRCRERLAVVDALIDRYGMEILRSYVAAVLGFLELGLGRTAAIPVLEELARFLAARPAADPEVLQWAPDLVEAYARAGRRRDAQAALDEFAVTAERSGGRWALSTLARCRGLLAPDRAYAAHFRDALAGHATPFETARTQLCFGERLRRSGLRTEARDATDAALRTFQRLGARPWAARAHAELGTPDARPGGARDVTGRLTAKELQVASTVAGGASNRDAAAALFLSTKTIEFHLRNIYRKLGVGSRTELVRRILDADGHDGPATRGRPRTRAGPPGS